MCPRVATQSCLKSYICLCSVCPSQWRDHLTVTVFRADLRVVEIVAQEEVAAKRTGDQFQLISSVPRNRNSADRDHGTIDLKYEERHLGMMDER